MALIVVGIYIQSKKCGFLL